MNTKNKFRNVIFTYEIENYLIVKKMYCWILKILRLYNNKNNIYTYKKSINSYQINSSHINFNNKFDTKLVTE